MEQGNYQICSRCVMDTTAREITFDENGVCSFCHFFDEKIKPDWHRDESGYQKLQEIVKKIKDYGKNKEYDCIIGISGGVDSSYLTYFAKKILGLRPLVFHVDGGWNSELAVKNIENLVKKLDIDLFTYVVDWEEMRDLQLAFFKSGLANQDVPQDHAFFAMLYKYATQYNIKYVLTGGNLASESILPASWGYNAMDLKHLKAVHKCFGKVKLKTFPTVNFFQYYFYYPYIKGMVVVTPLNYIPYVKSDAIQFLEKEFGWRYYGCKHGESRFTNFFQTYFLPVRFGYDKRKAHLSSLILAGQMTRDEALKELQRPLYDEKAIEEAKIFVSKKLGITVDEFETFLTMPKKTFKDYPSNYRLSQLLRLISYIKRQARCK
ncbi:MAG: N-acetyl sugar amidotransferase [bacterium]